MSFRLTPQAQAEREDALAYQAREWGAKAARELATAFKNTFKQIGGWSPPGSVRENWAPRQYLWVRVEKYPYFAVWATGETAADRVIVRILHTSRDLGDAMDETDAWE